MMLTRRSTVAVVLAIAVAGVSAQQLPTFEVASVKASAPFDIQKVMSGQQRIGMRVDAGRVEIDGMPLPDIINTAFRVKAYQVTTPSGLNGLRFDIHATLPAGAKTDQVPEMLQALLADRFKLAYHRENKEQSVYALIVGKGGPKLVASAPDPPANQSAGDAAAPAGSPEGRGPSGLIGRGGASVQAGAGGRGAITFAGGGTGPLRMSMTPDGAIHLEADRLSISQLVDTLTRLVDRPVVDETGLKGNYRMALDLARDDLMNAMRAAGVNLPPGALGSGPGAPATPTAPDPSGGTTIFRSVEQLGLKLDPRKMPVDQIVIDHLERMPTED